MATKKTQEEFIKELIETQEGKYDYSKVEYINDSTQVCVICTIHGEFWATPNNLLRGRKCPKCSHRSKAYTTKEWVEEVAKKFPQNDYSITKYLKRDKPIEFICPKHGLVKQIAYRHMSIGCNHCRREENENKQRKKHEHFIESAIRLFGNKYTYLDFYKNAKTPINIHCNDCGNDFELTPHAHINKKRGCSICNGGVKLTHEQFVRRIKDKYQNKIDIVSHYKNMHTNISVKCNTCGTITQRIARNVYQGFKCSCCQKSKLESEVEQMLQQENIEYIYNFKDKEKLGRLTIDFFLPEYKVGIECQGEQHYEIIDFFGGKEKYDKRIERDKRKKILCKENDINLYDYQQNSPYDNQRVKRILV